MKLHIPSFVKGVLCAAVIGSISISALAATGAMTISVAPINIQVNGTTFKPTDANGKSVPVFAYNGTTYAPLRALAEAYGLEVGYDANTNMAFVVDPDNPVMPTPNPPATEHYVPTYAGISYKEFPGVPDFGQLYGMPLQAIVGPVIENHTYSIGFQYDTQYITAHTADYQNELISAGFTKTTSDGETIFIKQNVAVSIVQNCIMVMYTDSSVQNTATMNQYHDIVDFAAISDSISSQSDSIIYGSHVFFYSFNRQQDAYLECLRYMIALQENGCTFVCKSESNVSGRVPVIHFLSADKSHIIEIEISESADGTTTVVVSVESAQEYTRFLRNYSGTSIPDFGQFSGAIPLVVGNTYGYYYDYPKVTLSSPLDYAIILAANGFSPVSTTSEIYSNSTGALYIFSNGYEAVSFRIEKRDGISAFLITLHEG